MSHKASETKKSESSLVPCPYCEIFYEQQQDLSLLTPEERDRTECFCEGKGWILEKTITSIKVFWESLMPE